MISDLTVDRDARDRHERCDPEREERLTDALRPESLTETFRAETPVDPQSGRRRRALLDAALVRATAEIESERAQAVPELGPAAFDEALEAEDPIDRVDGWNRWGEAVERALPFDAALAEAIDQLGRRAGKAHGGELLAATEPMAPEVWLAIAERDVLAPGDDALRRLTRDRAAALGSHPGHGPDSIRALGEHAWWRGRRSLPLAALVRDLGPRWGVSTAIGVPGRAGPAALGAALRDVGRAAREEFQTGIGCREAALWADPAFPVAAGSLFGRLALRSPVAVGLPVDESTAAAVRLAEFLRPRRVAAALAAGTLGGIASCAEAERRRASRVAAEWYERAKGWPPGPEDLERARVRTHSASALRGLAYAVLLEEKLLTRWGRDWIREPGARVWLREAWEGETQEDAESMASQLDVGTIEGPVIWDAHRPSR